VPTADTLRRWRREGIIMWMTASRGTRFRKQWTTNYVLLAGILGLVNLKRGHPQATERSMAAPSTKHWQGLLDTSASRPTYASAMPGPGASA
jgi:hypothetical protein